MEFAPSQRIPNPKEQKKKDPKMNTIEKDPDYLNFLEMLSSKAEVLILLFVSLSVSVKVALAVDRTFCGTNLGGDRAEGERCQDWA